ncbi:MAG: (4Fe-4S)-binding protein [Marinifilaceae bacterium]|jgi:uncharacterized Fe-S cluster protein YjdI
MTEIRKEYSNGEVTVVWKPQLCIHSTICFRGLPKVFQPGKKPWIDVEKANSEELIRQVQKCPSGALSFFVNQPKGDPDEGPVKALETGVRVEVIPDGPLMVDGEFTMVDKDGKRSVQKEPGYFCRCGASKTKPFCDGSHHEVKFKD